MNKDNESKDNGLLIMPVSDNGASMRNILNALFSPVIREQYRLPSIQTVSFLFQDAVVKEAVTKKVKIDGEKLSMPEACLRLVKEVEPKAEVRFVTVVDYAKDIPQTILKAVKEVGKSNLVLDLTSGKKDITGILYTAGCISEIENMIYIDCRDEETGEFYTLSISDKEIAKKVKLTKFETISEIENLASLNHMDFIIYKKSVQEILPNQNEDYHVKFNHAIDYYFGKDYQNCIREIGLLNESIVKRLAEFLLEHFQDPRLKGTDNLGTILNLQREYEKCANPKRWNEKNGLQQTYEKMQPVFSHFPAIFEMVSAVVNYRNLVSHPKQFEPGRDDAKMVIDLMLRVCRSLSELKWLVDERSENE